MNACPVCQGTRRATSDDGQTFIDCPFHEGAVLVQIDEAALAGIRATLFVDPARQHQLEPAPVVEPSSRVDARGLRLGLLSLLVPSAIIGSLAIGLVVTHPATALAVFAVLVIGTVVLIRRTL